MFDHSSVLDGACVTETVLGPDSSIAKGECTHSLLGPFVGFHHQSLLIATCWPLGRGNIAYDAKIGANHTGRMNDQECLAGEGCFFGLGAVVKFPFNCILSPYSFVAMGAVCLPQRVAFPFSLISSSPPDRVGRSGLGMLIPGWVLHSNPYFLERCCFIFLDLNGIVSASCRS
jgi:hypothetical protein